MANETPPNFYVDPRNVRTPEYQKVMGEILEQKVCPLCPPMPWHPNPTLNEDDRSLITRIAYPYKNSKYHFLIVVKRHLELLDELEDEDLKSILDLSRWASREFNIRGGGLTMRFGDTLYTGATIKHLHAHLVVPTVEGEKANPVYFPIG